MSDLCNDQQLLLSPAAGHWAMMHHDHICHHTDNLVSSKSSGEPKVQCLCIVSCCYWHLHQSLYRSQSLPVFRDSRKALSILFCHITYWLLALTRLRLWPTRQFFFFGRLQLQGNWPETIQSDLLRHVLKTITRGTVSLHELQLLVTMVPPYSTMKNSRTFIFDNNLASRKMVVVPHRQSEACYGLSDTFLLFWTNRMALLWTLCIHVLHLPVHIHTVSRVVQLHIYVYMCIYICVYMCVCVCVWCVCVWVKETSQLPTAEAFFSLHQEQLRWAAILSSQLFFIYEGQWPVWFLFTYWGI